ncbi:macrophage scavenger receptor types I and II-like [Littorina saxatilis]|uniref:SRCR domain-containing protein n=1 Tax=Littorina saxatilis TaxID=31220 RepID=A0AAN9GAT2_9CAEN
MLSKLIFLCLHFLFIANGVTGRVRLVGGSHYWEGRVEVYQYGVWGTVCDDFWDDTDARVVCRELGYESSGAEAHSHAHFGRGSGVILLDDVRCQGWETELTDCTYTTHGTSMFGSCSHSEDAGVSCNGDNHIVSAISKTVEISVAAGVVGPIIVVAIIVIIIKKKAAITHRVGVVNNIPHYHQQGISVIKY